MKFLEKLSLALITVIGFFIVLHAPITVFIGAHFPDVVLYIKGWKEALILILAMAMIVLITVRRGWKFFIRDWIFWAIIGYVLLHVVYAIYQVISGGITHALLASLAINLRYIAYFGLVYSFIRLYPHYRSWCVRVGGIGAAVVLMFASLQLILPRDILSHIGYGEQTIMPYMTVDRNEEYVRFGSTLRGPNPLGAYAAIASVVLVSLAMRTRRTLSRRSMVAVVGALVLAILGLWVSYSRSALFAAVLGVGILLAIRFGRVIPKTAWLGIASLAVIAGLALVIFRDVPIISNVIFHENPGEGGQIDSNEAHLSSLAYGAQQMLKQPLGAGLGSTGSASLFTSEPLIVENQYLFIAHEVGWLGLLLFTIIFVEVMRRLWLRRFDWLSRAVFAAGIGMALIGIVLPVWVDDTVSIIWWGAAAVALGIMSKKELDSAKTKQKTA